MTSRVVFLSLMLLLCAGTAAYADAYDDCKNDCTNSQKQCFEGITLYDPAGIKEAQAVCRQENAGCVQKCHEVDTLGAEEIQKREAAAAAEAEEKKRQEEVRDAGGIKTYDPDTEIKAIIPDGGPKTDNPDGGIKTYKFSD